MRFRTGWIILAATAVVATTGATLPAASAAPAPTPVTTHEPPMVAAAVQHDVSPPLRDLPLLPDEARDRIQEATERRDTGHLQPRPQGTDPVRQSIQGTQATAPATTTNFEGVGNIDGLYPPDTNGRAGPNHYVQWVNSHFQIFNKSGVSLYGPAAGNTLWSGFGAPCATSNDGDPIVLYDAQADRWVMAQFTASNPYGECVAVSTTGDPTGSYYRYFFQFSTSIFYDYPHLGVWPDGYYMSANRFGASFQGASAIVFDRARMLNGQLATAQEFKLGTSYGTLLPADRDGAALPPAGAPSYFAELGSTALHFWRFHVDWTTPANSTFTGPTSLPIAAFNWLCPSTSSCVPQPGTSVGLDGLGDRLMHRLAYRNFGDHESLVVSHSVNAASTGTQAGLRWYEIRNTGGALSIYQQGTFAPSDDVHRWLSSAAMDQSGNIAIGYSAAGTSVYAGIRYTGRLAGDALGQLTQGETTLIAGSGSQTGSANRWGDYAAMALDPTDDCTFWFTSEYMPTTGAAPWHTRVGSFKFASCGATGSSTPTPTPTATSTQTPTATNTPTATQTASPTATSTLTTGDTPTPTSTPASTATSTATATGTSTSTPGAVPSAPQNLSAAPANGRGVNLTWSAPGGSQVTGYNVYRSTTSGGETLFISLGNQLSYKDAATTRGQVYYYQVTAVNSGGEGPRSDEKSAPAT